MKWVSGDIFSNLDLIFICLALRKTMVDAHRQAWIWQDEWFGMTMEDIRRLELQTQEYLKKRMANNLEENEELLKYDSNYTLNGASSNYQMVDLNVINKDNENYDFLQFNLPKTKKNSISQHSNGSNVMENEIAEKRKSFQSNLHSPSKYFFKVFFNTFYFDLFR